MIAPYAAADAKGLLKSAIRDPNPVVFLENELLYGRSFEVPTDPDYLVPIGRAKVIRKGVHVTIAAFSRMCEQQPEMVAFTDTCLVHRAEIMQFRGAWPDAIWAPQLSAYARS